MKKPNNIGGNAMMTTTTTTLTSIHTYAMTTMTINVQTRSQQQLQIAKVKEKIVCLLLQCWTSNERKKIVVFVIYKVQKDGKEIFSRSFSLSCKKKNEDVHLRDGKKLGKCKIFN